MRSLFRTLDEEGVEFLLIGGQAAVLYGAAFFTQDIDLWIRPAAGNVQALLRALSRLDARVHKLTPPMTPALLRRGHGFHFLIPQARRLPAYFDVMGRPPRVRSFARARRRATCFDTPWGRLPVPAVEDLVELKKTNRPGDYETISRLTRIRLVPETTPSVRLLQWALDHAFRVEDAFALVAAFWGLLRGRESTFAPPLRRILVAQGRSRPPSAGDRSLLARHLDRRIAALMEAGRDYWVPRIRELKEMRAQGKLLREGLPVRELIH